MNIIERFKLGDLVVGCDTEEKADKFMGVMHDNGIKWSNGSSCLENNYWDIYVTETCYRCTNVRLSYADYDYYDYDGDVDYTIITFDKFMEEYTKMKQFTKDDLKTGMLVVTRDGRKWIVMKDLYDKNYEETGVLSNLDEFNLLASYNDDLTFISRSGKHIEKLDIVEVYDVKSILDFDIIYRKLLWKREEVKELTVGEISKLLGYKVKIVDGE